jgi:hypothetical protein
MKSRLGHKLPIRRARRDPDRLCPVCGQRRLVRDFITKKKQRGLNLFCNFCKQQNPEGVRRFLQAGRTAKGKPVFIRKEVIKILLEFARRRSTKREGNFGAPLEPSLKVQEILSSHEEAIFSIPERSARPYYIIKESL